MKIPASGAAQNADLDLLKPKLGSILDVERVSLRVFARRSPLS